MLLPCLIFSLLITHITAAPLASGVGVNRENTTLIGKRSHALNTIVLEERSLLLEKYDIGEDIDGGLENTLETLPERSKDSLRYAEERNMLPLEDIKRINSASLEKETLAEESIVSEKNRLPPRAGDAIFDTLEDDLSQNPKKSSISFREDTNETMRNLVVGNAISFQAPKLTPFVSMLTMTLPSLDITFGTI